MEQTSTHLPTIGTDNTHAVAPQSLATATPLQKDILRVLAYFDVFQHPLTAEEIYSFLPSNSTSPQAVSDACCSSPLTDIISPVGGYFLLKTNDASTVFERLEKEERARKHKKMASVITRIIKHVPFVRAVFVSGELAKGVASRNGDVDFVVVTERGRLWICRTLLIGFKKIALLNNKKYFCLNHLMTEDNLVVHKRSIYTAVEVVTLKPMLNESLFGAYLKQNEWTERYLPNYGVREYRTSAPQGSLLQRCFEFFLFPSLAEWLDVNLLAFWKFVWERRYPTLTTEKRNEIFHCSRDLSTAYAGDFSSKILLSYQQRLAQFGLNG
ncbi:MAG TPA: hypothetical protein VII11_05315 [Bacteroidota bacterium]